MKPLAMFHKNRVIQIRRGTQLDQLYHIRTKVNSADGGTRPDKLKIHDVWPGSVWQEGYPWMKIYINEAVENGYIKPASELSLSIHKTCKSVLHSILLHLKVQEGR